MKIVNLGCGTKTSSDTNVINIDWSILLRIKQNTLAKTIARIFLDKTRTAKLDALPENLVLHDLRKPLPFGDSSIDMVYHSHVLEHIDREFAPNFMNEIRRVLKPNGIQRIVVPDFERYCRAYLEHFMKCDSLKEKEIIEKHDDMLYPILGMSVQREASGTAAQKQPRRFIENFFLGDARSRGQTHQWMYDRYNLESLLLKSGFSEVKQLTYNTSNFNGWSNLRLDADESGNEYKTESLYIEARVANQE